MAAEIQLKRSSVAGKIPDAGNVLVGEPVVNLADKTVYTKNGSGNIILIGAGNLSSLADVSNAAPISGQVLAWNSSIYKWEPTSTGATGGNVFSVGGLTGDISNAQLAAGISTAGILTTANVTELTNLYFTNARVYANVIQIGYATNANVTQAYNQANTATTNASSAFDKANSAYTVATSAFDSSNTKVATVAGVTATTISNAQLAAGIALTSVSNLTIQGNISISGLVDDRDISVDGTKLDTIATGAEVNQNAFTTITIAGNDIVADSKTDTLTLVAGVNVTLTPDVANDTITISANDTSVDWSEITNKPDPVVTVTLTGDVTGTGNTTLADLANGTITVNTTVVSDAIVLGSDTTGAYVANLVQGSGIALSGLGNEGTTPTIALATSGVAAATYGSSTNIPSIAVDQFGRITSASNVAIVSGVSSVAGATGAVSNAQLAAGISSSGLLTTANVSELTNLYYTNARVYANVTQIGYASNADVTQAYNQANTATTNASSAFDKANTSTTIATSAFDKANSAFTVATSAFDSSNTKVATVAGVTAASISNAQLASGITSSGVLTTANVSEVTNLYYTNARVYANVVAAGFYDTVSNTAPIGASESGTTLTLSHLNSGVSATTYGGASTVPVFTVNATGHITSASNVTSTVANSNITGNILFSQINPMTSAQFATIVSDETGSGAVVLATTPTLVTPNIGAATASSLSVDGVNFIDTATLTTSSTAQTELALFSTSTYGSGEVLIQANQGNFRHISKLLVCHDNTTAIATEFGTLTTGNVLFTTEVDINTGNVRILLTPSSATSTTFKATLSLVSL